MRYMNDYDIQRARQRFTRASCPNRLALAIVVDRLREWADEVSDGWAYWQQPLRAAQRAISLIESTTVYDDNEQESHDITEAEMLAAVRPIKAFLTRAKRDGIRLTDERRDLILRASEPMFKVI